MTLPHERTRAVIQAQRFFLEIDRDSALPESIRREAHRLLRHYPSESDVLRAARQELTEKRLIFGPVFGAEVVDE